MIARPAIPTHLLTAASSDEFVIYMASSAQRRNAHVTICCMVLTFCAREASLRTSEVLLWLLATRVYPRVVTCASSSAGWSTWLGAFMWRLLVSLRLHMQAPHGIE